MSSPAATTATSASASDKQPRIGHLKLAPWLACAAVIGAVIYSVSSWDAWTSNRPTQSTQNAFVKSEPAVLSARVGGYVRGLPVADYQTVKAGDLIAEIESDDYAVRVQAAEASLAKAQAVLDNLGNEEAERHAAIEQAEASLHASEARLTQSQQDFDRKSQLVTNGSISRKSFDDAKAELAAAEASREAAAAALTFARRQLDTLAGQRAQRMADLNAAAASLASARLELGYTKLIAPFDGTLGRRGVQIGSLVASGTQIVTIVPLTQTYVIANYKETQLKNVRAGQPVEVAIDALPGYRFQGRVEQIAPMSGNESSLIPTDNATGNFTKVVQRIPVRIELEPGQADLDLLRPGMSAEARIDTLGAKVAAYTREIRTVTKETYADAVR
ncbi:HlyD family secretion protein [Agrobacterium tumefaciens]|uniref:HlyD family secretion protein n=1 Tax=Agrobacterium tumefaciens TaxID=358 RepID=UPI00157258B0|nr:HlyD family secretion protein [Agrobacterium tumefaciens]NSX86333.1 HlyD family secretion protein [Agrobacterium tumefaciens]